MWAQDRRRYETGARTKEYRKGEFLERFKKSTESVAVESEKSERKSRATIGSEKKYTELVVAG